jgi:hypothetical protein
MNKHTKVLQGMHYRFFGKGYILSIGKKNGDSPTITPSTLVFGPVSRHDCKFPYLHAMPQLIDQIKSILSDDGTLAALPGFEFRPQQLAMAEAIAAALQEKIIS